MAFKVSSNTAIWPRHLDVASAYEFQIWIDLSETVLEYSNLPNTKVIKALDQFS